MSISESCEGTARGPVIASRKELVAVPLKFRFKNECAKQNCPIDFHDPDISKTIGGAQC
jgi:hypothetical protein